MSLAPSHAASPASGLPGRSVRRALVLQALHFWIRDPLHYLADISEPGFGPHWPRRGWLLLHIIGGTLALFLGPWQFWPGVRARHPRLHRISGRLYVAGVAAGGAAGFQLSFFAQPRDFGVALFVLAAAWWLTVGMAVLAIRHRQIDAHRAWMVRGYVLTFAFVVFRAGLDLPVFAPLGAARISTVAWLSWVVPLLVTEAALQWRRTRGA